MRYKATTRNNIIDQSEVIIADSFSSIFLKNVGGDDVVINDNIKILPGESFSFDNHPNVIIAENITVHFKTSTDPKLLVIKTYFNEY